MAEAGEAEVALLIQGEVAHPGIAHVALRVLDGEEAVPDDGKIQGQVRGLRNALAVIGVNTAGRAYVALAANFCTAAVVHVHPAVHDVVKGGGHIAVLFVACRGDVDHIVADDVQVVLVRQHGRGQIVKALIHALSPLPLRFRLRLIAQVAFHISPQLLDGPGVYLGDAGLAELHHLGNLF